MCPSANICSIPYVINLRFSLSANPIKHMAPLTIKRNLNGRGNNHCQFPSCLQILQKSLCIIQKSPRSMRTCLDTGATFNAFVIINQDTKLPILIHPCYICLTCRTCPDTCIASYTLLFIYIDNTHYVYPPSPITL